MTGPRIYRFNSLYLLIITIGSYVKIRNTMAIDANIDRELSYWSSEIQLPPMYNMNEKTLPVAFANNVELQRCANSHESELDASFPQIDVSSDGRRQFRSPSTQPLDGPSPGSVSSTKTERYSPANIVSFPNINHSDSLSKSSTDIASLNPINPNNSEVGPVARPNTHSNGPPVDSVQSQINSESIRDQLNSVGVSNLNTDSVKKEGKTYGDSIQDSNVSMLKSETVQLERLNQNLPETDLVNKQSKKIDSPIGSVVAVAQPDRSDIILSPTIPNKINDSRDFDSSITLANEKGNPSSLINPVQPTKYLKTPTVDDIRKSPSSGSMSSDSLSKKPSQSDSVRHLEPAILPRPSVALLNLPNRTVYAVPDIDSPAHPVFNSKRAIQRRKPSLRRKTLTQSSNSQVHPKVSNLSAQQTSSSTDSNLYVSEQGTQPQEDIEKRNPDKSPLVKRPPRKESTSRSGGASNVASQQTVVSNGKIVGAKATSDVQSSSNNSSLPDSSHSLNEKVLASESRSKKTDQLVSCTCGVFLTGQFTKGSSAEPRSNPVVEHQVGQSFPCTPAGRVQCQNKCIDLVVKHLPNSGTIICGSLDKDVYKEKAYLWVKNCQDVWINTNLSSGKEHCCKDSQPIKCSQMTV